MFSKRIHAVWFGIHFLFITAVCIAGLFSLIAKSSTILPSACSRYARRIELVAVWVLGKQASASNPLRHAIATYLHAAGIQAGYTFFAPNIPSNHRLTFELFYGDGRIEYESPHVRSKAAALRLDSLLDRLAEQRYEPLREVVVKMLALSVWRQHPDVRKVRAIFASVNVPTITEFEQGKAETSKPMFTFDFSVREKQEH
jgi:hypothetical protein